MDGQKGFSFFLAHTPSLEKYQTFLEGHKFLTKSFSALVLAALCAGGVGYLNWAAQQMLSEGGFSLLCVLSPFSSKANLPQLSPLCDHKSWAPFPHSVGFLPGLQQGLAGMRHLAHRAASRNGCPWA